MPYQKVQFIGYAVHTAPLANYTFTGDLSGKPFYLEEKFYLGNPLASRDIQVRVSIMKEAIETAARSGHCAGSDTLKVFMAPEFFFRGVLGAYAMDDAQTVLDALRAALRGGAYAHWLFIFGTTLGFSRGTGSVHAGAKEVYNFASVQKGSGEIDDARVVMKEFKSGIDFIGDRVRFTGSVWMAPRRAIGLTDSSVEHLAPASGAGVGKERQRFAFDGNSIFEIDGITFGLEVCLDHAEKRLRNSPSAVGEALVQIQLVPSAGMEICAGSIVALKNGFVFNCDGSYELPGRTTGAHSTLKKVTKMHTGIADAETEDIAPSHTLPVTAVAAFDQFFAEGPGAVHIYPTQALPASRTA